MSYKIEMSTREPGSSWGEPQDITNQMGIDTLKAPIEVTIQGPLLLPEGAIVDTDQEFPKRRVMLYANGKGGIVLDNRKIIVRREEK